MTERTLDLSQRLDRLERENRRLKRIGAGVLVGLASVVLMGQALPSKVAKVVEAEKFVLRNRTGAELAVLDQGLDDGGRLTIMDERGRGRARLSDQGVHLYGENGDALTWLRESFLWVGAQTGRAGAWIQVDTWGETSFGLQDKDGKVLWKAPVAREIR
jgi:hypothetical protein